MLRDPIFRRQGLALLLLTALGAGLGFCLSPSAGLLALGLCHSFFLLLLQGYRRQRATLERLCADLNRILHGDTSVNLDAYSEGNWSVLHNQLEKLLGQLLEQSELLTRDKSRLAASIADISHQIRTPLTALNLLAARLSAPELPEEARRNAGRDLRRQLERLDWLVSALLRMSRLDAGTAELRREPVSLRRAVEQAAAPLGIPMELQEQKLVLTGDAVIPGDLSWTVEALGNLLKNAMEHTPPSGTVTVEIGDNPLYGEVIVRDTGPGFDPEDLPHLFERFYRGKNAGPQSVGIGLCLARMIITAQNGTIQAANRRTGGAQFTVRFYRGAV